VSEEKLNYKQVKWKTTKSVWGKSFNENLQDIINMNEISTNEDYDEKLKEIKKKIVLSVDYEEPDEDYVKILSSDEKAELFLLHYYNQIIEVGMTERKSKEEVIGMMLQAVISIKKPNYTLWEKSRKFFRKLYFRLTLKGA
jgi:hypothetical protein